MRQEAASKAAEIGDLEDENKQQSDPVARLSPAAERLAKQEAYSEDENAQKAFGEIQGEAIE